MLFYLGGSQLKKTEFQRGKVTSLFSYLAGEAGLKLGFIVC